MPVVEVVWLEFDCLFFTIVINVSIDFPIGLFYAILLYFLVNTILHNLVSHNGWRGNIINVVTRVALYLTILRLKNANHSGKLAGKIFYYFFLPQFFIIVYDLLHGKVA